MADKQDSEESKYGLFSDSLMDEFLHFGDDLMDKAKAVYSKCVENGKYALAKKIQRKYGFRISTGYDSRTVAMSFAVIAAAERKKNK